jgi:CHAT domain-containing protein
LALPGQEDSPATPAAVLGVLPATTTAGASMLHLVCHGMATSAGAGASFLELEDATEGLGELTGARPGRLLTVRAILRQAGGRPAAAPGGIVTLAACRTDVTATDHDEALTLSTAFLAAGAVTVVGSRWDLLDAHNAVLMYMFHHYLVAAGQRPADALRSAQLWMLDPDREPPSSMPADLRDRWGLDHVLAWAGLTHQGQ